MARAEIKPGLDRVSKTERELKRTRRGVNAFLRVIDKLVTKYNQEPRVDGEYSTPFKPIRLHDDPCEVQAQAFYGADGKIVRGTLHLVGTLKGKPINAYRSLSVHDLPDVKTLNLRLRFASVISREFLGSSKKTSKLPRKAISN